MKFLTALIFHPVSTENAIECVLFITNSLTTLSVVHEGLGWFFANNCAQPAELFLRSFVPFQ
jgi:hypothetical protein